MKKRIIITLLCLFMALPSFAVMYDYQTEYGRGMADAYPIDELYGKKELVTQDYLFQKFGKKGNIGIKKLLKIQKELMIKVLNEYEYEPGEVWLVYSRPDDKQYAFILVYIEEDYSLTYVAIGEDVFMY